MSKKSEEGWRLAVGYRVELVKAKDRIAELEAENEALHDYAQGELERANKAEAELAALKAKCGKCPVLTTWCRWC